MAKISVQYDIKIKNLSKKILEKRNARSVLHANGNILTSVF